MGKVIKYTGITTLDLHPDVILSEAIEKLEGVVVIGYDKNGKEYFASSYADGGTIIWLVERLKKLLLKV